jgi:hypothetical protein
MRVLRREPAHGYSFRAKPSVRGLSPHAEMLAQYADLDIALDPLPFGGGLMSCVEIGLILGPESSNYRVISI